MSDTTRETARQSYTYLRFGMLAVVIGLAVAIGVEAVLERCVQRSVSAYYFTPVRNVFVGGLIAIGMAMVALWSRNKADEAFMNLAGMFAPVVAFVPTADANYCSTNRAAPEGRTETDTATSVINASHAATDNNIIAYIVVVIVCLAFLMRRNRVEFPQESRYRNPGAMLKPDLEPGTWAVGISYLLAIAALLVGVVTFFFFRDGFYDRAHYVAAVALFVCIVVVVFANAYDNRFGDVEEETAGAFLKALVRRRLWQLHKTSYGKLGWAMIVAAIVIFVVGKATGWDHWVLVIEGALLMLFFWFWVKQTVELSGKLPGDQTAASPEGPSQGRPGERPGYGPGEGPTAAHTRSGAEPVPPQA